MDWAAAIDRNRNALIAVVETLFRMLGLAGDATLARLQPHLRRKVLRLLRPAESACRRLIVIAARGLALPPPPVARVKPLGQNRQGASCAGPLNRAAPGLQAL